MLEASRGFSHSFHPFLLPPHGPTLPAQSEQTACLLPAHARACPKPVWSHAQLCPTLPALLVFAQLIVPLLGVLPCTCPC